MMKPQYYRLVPELKETIWGGEKLSRYGYELPSDHVGEAWTISAHANGSSRVLGGTEDGRTLRDIVSEHPEYFGLAAGKEFPLLIKIIDAHDNLSIQVHPDDAYAAEHENGSLGKTECWYILDCEENTQIVIGHHAKNKEELTSMIDDGRFEDLIRRIPVQKGDFFQIDPGTVHAIQGGTVILETQQSSDITYRVYDYGRLQNGKPRQLHLEQSKDVIRTPFVPEETKPVGREVPGGVVTRLISCDFYTVDHTLTDNSEDLEFDPNPDADVSFLNFTVVEGEGSVNGIPVKKGDNLIFTAGNQKLTLRGSMEVITSFPK